MSDRLAQLADIVLRIEAEMRRLDIWERQPPSAAALASTLPFCYDTLQFPQWVQWVFLSRMQQIIQAGGPLPANSGIHAMVEHYCRENGLEAPTWIALFAEFDRALSDHNA